MSEASTILIVDDNPAMAETLSDILTIMDYEVYVAFSGSAALAILRDHDVDILLTDVVMPDMNGIDLFRRARQTCPRITTFLMTAYADDDLIQQGLAEGVRMVLSKPVDINLLLTLL